MRYVLIILMAGFLASCGFNRPTGDSDAPVVKGRSAVDPMKLAQLKITNTFDYRKALDQLDVGNLTSLDIAGALLLNSSADTLARDSMFVAYQDFLTRVTGGYPENNESVGKLLGNSPSAETVMPLKLKLANYGIVLKLANNTYHLEPQSSYLLQKFGPELSFAFRQYLTSRSLDQQEPFASSDKILIPADSLASRIVRWEDFISGYPHFILIKNAQDQYSKYLGAFLTGMENSRVFDKETNHLSDSSKVSFESFVKKNPETKSAGVVEAYLQMLKSTNFNYTDRVDSFLLEKVYNAPVAEEGDQ